jgi:hypothetical protein
LGFSGNILKSEGHICLLSFLFPAIWNADMIAEVPAAILDCGAMWQGAAKQEGLKFLMTLD